MLHHGPRGRVGRWVFLLTGMVTVMLVVLPVPTVIGQTPEPVPVQPPTFELPEVIVPGKRPQPATSTPASVTVISRDEIQRSGARTVADAVRMVAEVSVRAYGGAGELAQPRIRGAPPPQVLVLLGGIPLDNGALGPTELRTIALDCVERLRH